MCGIIGYIGFQDPKGILLDGLKRLEYRGYDSAGIAILEGNKTLLFRSEGRIQKLESKLTQEHFQGHLGIDRKSTRLNSSHSQQSRMPSSA